MIYQQQFENITNLFTTHRAVFLVPTFQRPFAWEVDKEVEMLIIDIVNAHNRGARIHYLAPMHLIKVDTLDAAQVVLLREYVDPNLGFPLPNPNAGLLDDNGNPVDLYLVVDGQQRLTTLYAMMHTLNLAGPPIQIGGQKIPRVIPGSPEEYHALRLALGLSGLTGAPGASCAATRLTDVFAALGRDLRLPGIKLFLQQFLKTLPICLEPRFALGSFLTLNDRGKKLTTLEKVKAHLLYLDQLAGGAATMQIHNQLGQVYRSIEDPDSTLNDDNLVQVFCIWEFPLNADKTGWGADTWYEKDISPAPGLGGTWLTSLGDIAQSNVDVSDFLSGRAQQATSPSAIQPSSRTARDDYLVTIKSGLTHRGLSLLLKLRARFGIDLHARIATVTLNNVDILHHITRRVNALSGALLTAGLSPAALHLLQPEIARIQTKVNGIPASQSRTISCLELVEMLELGSVKPGSFVGTWNQMAGAAGINQIFQSWIWHIESWRGRYKYLREVLDPGDTSRDSFAYRLILDVEASGGRHWPFNNSHEVEHIFPRNGFSALPNPGAYGFGSEQDYDNLVNSTGNLLPLDAGLNKSLGNMPPNQKAPHYVSQTLVTGRSAVPAHLTPQTYSPLAVSVGNDLMAVVNDPLAMRYLIDLRTIELAVHAVCRY